VRYLQVGKIFLLSMILDFFKKIIIILIIIVDGRLNVGCAIQGFQGYLKGNPASETTI